MTDLNRERSHDSTLSPAPVLMVSRPAFDLTTVALIYWNWESAIAHVFFQQPYSIDGRNNDTFK